MLQAKAAHKAAFEAAVRAEFARIMAVGKNTANEAAALAVAAARQSLSRQLKLCMVLEGEVERIAL